MRYTARCKDCPGRFAGTVPRSMRDVLDTWGEIHLRHNPGHRIGVEEIDDIPVPPAAMARAGRPRNGSSRVDEDALLQIIDGSTRTITVGPAIDELVAKTGLSRGTLHPRLVRMQKRGLIKKTDIGWVRS